MWLISLPRAAAMIHAANGIIPKLIRVNRWLQGIKKNISAGGFIENRGEPGRDPSAKKSKEKYKKSKLWNGSLVSSSGWNSHQKGSGTVSNQCVRVGPAFRTHTYTYTCSLSPPNGPSVPKPLRWLLSGPARQVTGGWERWGRGRKVVGDSLRQKVTQGGGSSTHSGRK